MSKNILFIINPISGTGKTANWESLMSGAFSEHSYKIAYTQYRGHATDIAKAACEEPYDIICAVGGDGTVHEVGKALVGTNKTLGILPIGSGNGLARHLKIPLKIEKAFGVLKDGIPNKIDTLLINDAICLGIAGIGFDAHIAHLFSAYGKRGFSTYIKLIFSEYGKYAPLHFKLSMNNETIEREALLLTFANSSQYGNQAVIAPFADIRDGMMEVCILQKLPVFKAFGFAYKMFSGKAHTSNYIETIKTSDITVLNYQQKTMHIDGEPVFTEETVRIKINPLSLNVITPDGRQK